MSIKKVLTDVRFSYANVFEPKQVMGEGPEKYSVTILIPKTNTKTVAQINEGIKQALNEGLAKKFSGKMPAQPKNPLHDGDGYKNNGEPYGDECKGCYVMTATCKADQPPEVVIGPNCEPIMTQSEFYSGCYGHVCVNFSAYNSKGTKGVGCYLKSIMKTQDGEPLAGKRTSAAEDFADFSTGDTEPAFTQRINPLTGEPMA